MWSRPARMRGQPVKPHTSARRAPRCGANGCADVRFLTCAAVQPLIFRPQAAYWGQGSPCKCRFDIKRRCLRFSCAAQEKPKTLSESHATVSYTTYNLAFLHFEFRSRYISRYAGSKVDFLLCVVATIVATAAIQAALPGSRRLLAAVFVSFAFSTRRFSPPNRIGAQISKILS